MYALNWDSKLNRSGPPFPFDLDLVFFFASRHFIVNDLVTKSDRRCRLPFSSIFYYYYYYFWLELCVAWHGRIITFSSWQNLSETSYNLFFSPYDPKTRGDFPPWLEMPTVRMNEELSPYLSFSFSYLLLWLTWNWLATVRWCKCDLTFFSAVEKKSFEPLFKIQTIRRF